MGHHSIANISEYMLVNIRVISFPFCHYISGLEWPTNVWLEMTGQRHLEIIFKFAKNLKMIVTNRNLFLQMMTLGVHNVENLKCHALLLLRGGNPQVQTQEKPTPSEKTNL